jgi:hypothetical protein
MTITIRKGGRPRLSGAREPNGRVARRISEAELDWRSAQGIWADFQEATSREGRRLPWSSWSARHPLLNQVRFGKMDANSFAILIYWICTDVSLAPDWSTRASLTKATGFDFCTREGCLGARRRALQTLGEHTVQILDAAALGGEARTGIPALNECLTTLWAAWCK